MGYLGVARPHCVADDFGGEIVVLNLETGLYFSLPGLAGAIWRDLNAGHSSEDIFSELAAIDDTLGENVRRLIQSLVSHGLLRETHRPEGSVADPEYRGLIERGVYQVACNAYDDMKDLVMTDPIHEVEEQFGWPVRQAQGAESG